MGILPAQLYDMELWEFNACTRAYNRRQEITGKEQLAISWQTAAFTGAAFAGKLKKLSYYMAKMQGKHAKTHAPKISRQDFERKLKLLEGGAVDGTQGS